MTNVPLEHQTKESLIAYIQSLEGTCKTQDEAAQKAQLEMGQAGLMVMRFRNALERLKPGLYQRLSDDQWRVGYNNPQEHHPMSVVEQALTLPATQADKQAVALMEYANACDDVLDAVFIFVTQRKSAMEAAVGYTEPPVQESLQMADKARKKLYESQGRDLNTHERLQDLRYKLKACLETKLK